MNKHIFLCAGIVLFQGTLFGAINSSSSSSSPSFNHSEEASAFEKFQRNKMLNRSPYQIFDDILYFNIISHHLPQVALSQIKLICTKNHPLLVNSALSIFFMNHTIDKTIPVHKFLADFWCYTLAWRDLQQMQRNENLIDLIDKEQTTAVLACVQEKWLNLIQQTPESQTSRLNFISVLESMSKYAHCRQAIMEHQKAHIYNDIIKHLQTFINVAHSAMPPDRALQASGQPLATNIKN